MKLSILASNARTDALKTFTGDQLSMDAIVAAAAVPLLFSAVEIDGERYRGDGDLPALPQRRPIDVGHRLIIVGKPSGCVTPCADRRQAANSWCNEARTDSHHPRGAHVAQRCLHGSTGVS